MNLLTEFFNIGILSCLADWLILLFRRMIADIASWGQQPVWFLKKKSRDYRSIKFWEVSMMNILHAFIRTVNIMDNWYQNFCKLNSNLGRRRCEV